MEDAGELAGDRDFRALGTASLRYPHAPGFQGRPLAAPGQQHVSRLEQCDAGGELFTQHSRTRNNGSKAIVRLGWSSTNERTVADHRPPNRTGRVTQSHAISCECYSQGHVLVEPVFRALRSARVVHERSVPSRALDGTSPCGASVISAGVVAISFDRHGSQRFVRLTGLHQLASRTGAVLILCC